MKVTSPNGLVFDVPASIATGLVGDGSRGYSFMPEDEKPRTAPAPKRAPGRPRKQLPAK